MTEPKKPTIVYREPTIEQIEKMLADRKEKYDADRKELTATYSAERNHLKAWLRSARDRAESKQPNLPGM